MNVVLQDAPPADRLSRPLAENVQHELRFEHRRDREAVLTVVVQRVPDLLQGVGLAVVLLFEALPIHRAELGVGELGPVLEIESLPLGTRLGDEQAPFEERERPVSLQLVPFEHRRQDRIGDDVLFAES